MTLAVAKWLPKDASHTETYLIQSMQELGKNDLGSSFGRDFWSGCSQRVQCHIIVGVMDFPCG